MAQRPTVDQEQLWLCAERQKIGIAAKSYRGIGWSEAAATEQLVAEYAYGPHGEVYRDSAAIEELIGKIVAATYAGQDFSSTMEYLRCTRAAARR